MEEFGWYGQSRDAKLNDIGSDMPFGVIFVNGGNSVSYVPLGFLNTLITCIYKCKLEQK